MPQLWNVARGEMGVVGPRPTLPEQVVHYSRRQRGRLDVRPGLTGWAQVQGRNSIGWPERIELDLWYVEHRSLLLDLRILVRTVGVLLRPSGITAAGGVNPGFPAPTEAAETPAGHTAPARPVPAQPVPDHPAPDHPVPDHVGTAAGPAPVVPFPTISLPRQATGTRLAQPVRAAVEEAS
ncbi:sugar transferase [Kitasatospora aburaviensis]